MTWESQKIFGDFKQKSRELKAMTIQQPKCYKS